MLIRELFEAINVSHHHNDVKNKLFNTILNNGDLLASIKKIVEDLSGYDINVQIKSMPKGDGSYVHDEKTLYINKPVIHHLVSAYEQYVKATSGKDTKKHDLIDKVNRLVTILLHEITHIIQLHKSIEPYEKSYVYNKQVVDKALTHLGLKSKKQRANYQGDKEDLNLKKLNVYLARLGDPNSEINMVVDRAQPEEITAYANQTASEIIATIPTDDKRFQKTQLRHALKQIKNSKNNLTKSIKDYKIVNKYSKKAHDKFFKLLYLNLMYYYDSIS